MTEELGNGPTAVASQPGDGFVVVWNAQDYRNGIFGRMFSSAGTPIGSEFQVNQSAEDVHTVDVCSAADGGFVVAWEGEYFTPEDTIESVWVRIFDAQGRAVGGEIRLQSENHASFPKVSCATDGRFVAVWSNDRRFTLARGFDSSGQPLGSAFRIQSHRSAVRRLRAEVAVQRDGRFLVVWIDHEEDRMLGRVFMPSMRSCSGDCDASGGVSIDELLVGVGIALARQSVSVCPPMDADENGSVSVGDLAEAVGHALSGCPPTATPTEPSRTATPTTTPSPSSSGPRAVFRLLDSSEVTRPDGLTEPLDGVLSLSLCVSPNTFYAGRVDSLEFVSDSVRVLGIPESGHVVASTLYGGSTPVRFSAATNVNGEELRLSGRGPMDLRMPGRLDLQLAAGQYAFHVVADREEYVTGEGPMPYCGDWGFL